MLLVEENFDGFELHDILCHDNKVADALTKLDSTQDWVLPGVFVKVLQTPSDYRTPPKKTLMN